MATQFSTFLPFISVDEFEDEGQIELAKSQRVSLHFLPDEAGRGRTFTSVFVALWSEIFHY